MTLILNHCSNPRCHNAYAGPANYREAIALMELGDGSLDYRVFSICSFCKKLLNDLMVAETIKDIIEYETTEKKNMTSTTKRDMDFWNGKYAQYRIVAWANNRMELDEKLAIK